MEISHHAPHRANIPERIRELRPRAHVNAMDYAKPFLFKVDLKVEHCMCCTISIKTGGDGVQTRTPLCPVTAAAGRVVEVPIVAIETELASVVIAG